MKNLLSWKPHSTKETIFSKYWYVHVTDQFGYLRGYPTGNNIINQYTNKEEPEWYFEISWESNAPNWGPWLYFETCKTIEQLQRCFSLSLTETTKDYVDMQIMFYPD